MAYFRLDWKLVKRDEPQTVTSGTIAPHSSVVGGSDRSAAFVTFAREVERLNPDCMVIPIEIRPL